MDIPSVPLEPWPFEMGKAPEQAPWALGAK